MPVVPYGPRKVLTAALPGLRKTAALTETAAGVGVEQAKAEAAFAKGRAGQTVGAAIAQVGGVMSQVGEDLGRWGMAARTEERERANEIAVLHVQRALGDWEHRRLYDPETGALTKHGTDSFELPETVGAEYTALAGELAATLTNDDQRIAFAKIASTRALSLDLTLRRHVYTEIQRYEAEELQATVVNARNAAIANATTPRRVGLELSTAVHAIETHGPRLGLGPEQVQQQVEATRTEIHVGVIESLLAQNLTPSAKVYFEETKKQITGTAIARIEKALEEGQLRKRAQEETDKILATGGTLTEQRDKARAIEDPEIRDSVMQRLEHEAVIREKRWRDDDEAELRMIYDVVDRTHDVTTIPPGKWANLDGPQRAALRSYGNALAQGIPIETDWPAYYRLMQQAGEKPEDFIKENLLRHRNELGETEFKQLISLQLALRTGETKQAEKEIGGFQTKTQILEGALESYGLDPHPKDGTRQAKAIAQLRRLLDVSAQTQEVRTGKPPTNVDLVHMIDQILSRKETTPGSIWYGLFGGMPFFTTEKRLLDATVEDIPPDERKEIERDLWSRGRPVSDVTVLDNWLETMLRKKR